MRRPRSFIGRAFWILRTRPAQVAGAVRGILLFYWARAWRRIFPPPGVDLGRNVRLQRNRSVMAEAPDARIAIMDDAIVYENAKIEAYGKGRIEIGPESVLGDIKIVSRYGIKIGKRFLSSWNVFIEDFEPHPTDPSLRSQQVSHMVSAFRPRFGGGAASGNASEIWEARGWEFPGQEIVIGDDVWAGVGAIIFKGARIGDGCIIAAGAVVLRGQYPPNSVIAGNPGKVVKTLSRS